MYISERVLMKTTADDINADKGLNLGRYLVASLVSVVVVSGAVMSQIL